MKKTILFVIFFCIIGFSLCSLAEGNYGVNLSSAAYQPASSGGSNVFSEGQCTWYAWGRAYEKGMSFYWGNGHFGNACDWYKNAKDAGYHCEATPRSNSIAVWEAGNHVAFVENVDGNIIYISEGNHYYNGAYLKYAEAKINTTNGFYELTYGYGYSSVNQKYTGSSPDGYIYLQNPNNEPYGSLDLASGSKGTIRVAGWAKDDDSPDQSLSIHVYVGGPAGSGAPVYAIKANGYRPDIGGNYAYDDIIAVSPFGAQKVYVYAIDTNNGSNPCIGEATVNIERDTSAPVISNIVVSDISSTGYRVTCNISDDVKISKVQFPTWTKSGGQDDIIWHDVSVVNGEATYYIKSIDHNHESGIYTTHIYAWDAAGNEASVKDNTMADLRVSVPSPISNVRVTDITDQGYTVKCTFDTNWGASKIEFPTWSIQDGQDDLASSWPQGMVVNGEVTFIVKVSDHNNENACNYMTHIYASDTKGNKAAVSDEQYSCLLVYVPASSYRIVYDGNAEDALNIPDTQIKAFGKTLVIINEKPTRNGYKFRGWAKIPTATKIDYQSGDDYTENQDITLYALWQRTYETVLELPRDLKIIDSEAFVGIGVDAVRIPEGVETIADGAFDVTVIILGYPDSAAERYAKKNGNVFIAIKKE